MAAVIVPKIKARMRDPIINIAEAVIV